VNTALYFKESLKATSLPNIYSYALLTRVLRVTVYIDDAYHRHTKKGFQCKIDVRNAFGKLYVSCLYHKQISYFLTDPRDSCYVYDPLNPSQRPTEKKSTVLNGNSVIFPEPNGDFIYETTRFFRIK
jgi:hypothetical protein